MQGHVRDKVLRSTTVDLLRISWERYEWNSNPVQNSDLILDFGLLGKERVSLQVLSMMAREDGI